MSKSKFWKRLRQAGLWACVLLILAAVAAWWAASTRPRWYVDAVASLAPEAERQMLAQNLEQQVHALQSWADATYVHARAKSEGRRLQVPPPPLEFDLRVSQAELNVLAEKWLVLSGRGGMPRISDLAVEMRPGELRVGLQLPEWKTGRRVVSSGVCEKGGDDGLEVIRPRLGLLPVPMGLLPATDLEGQRQRFAREAAMDNGGRGNSAAIAAGELRLAQQLLAGKLREDRVFLPLPASIAVRVKRSIQEGNLVATLSPLDQAEREDYLRALKGP